ncbi:MAG: PQQ-binding-like beta-propeller repeat protein [Candidatus Nealsonbacteria bacterium]|nr:PQQ-binding-like beta-propeller repeat protein [Candidatus Nealsonbacteria bacterium]
MHRIVRHLTSRVHFALTFAGICLAAPSVAATDWPTCRGDAGRSGYTADALPAELSLRWTVRSRHAPRPAWSGRDTRMPFDRAYRPVIAGEKLFFGSSADGKVYALDAATGTELWTFFTGGPVRFAPVVWKDRVFAASDDGYLYCLSADRGHLLWKCRGGPSDEMLLGNDRMISRWPARGGPVVADDVVYFAAGIWPSEGIYVYAIDAADGRVLWCNDSSGGITMPQPHGGAVAASGISAQGHLVVAGNRLLVPTGRAVPAVLDRNDGKLLYFHLQANRGTGGSQVVAAGPVFLNGGQVFDIASGAAVGKGIATGTVAATPRGLIYTVGNAILTSELKEQPTADRKGNAAAKITLGPPVRVTNNPLPGACALIAAGDAVIVGGENRIAVLDLPSKKIVFTAEVDGNACSLAVADGRLYASTDRGLIYCFDGSATTEPTRHEPPDPATPYAENDTAAAAADEIIRQTGITEGYCVDLDCGDSGSGDGALAYALAKKTSLMIYAVEADPVKVARAREKLDAAGLYGVRVTVHQGDPSATAYPDYFADLVISGRSIRDEENVALDDKMDRLQRPFGGVACVGKPGAMHTAVRGSLEGAGTWTHQYCDPANTACSTDTLAKGPLGMLWFTDLDFQVPSRHGRGPAPLSLDGRLYVAGLDAIRCVDAYNGRSLWEYPLPAYLKAYDQEHLMGTAGTGANWCVSTNGLYVRTGSKCLKIDRLSGKLLAEFDAPKLPDGSEGVWAYVACVDGTLVGTLADTEHLVKYRYGRSDMSTQFTESVLLFAMDAKTGKLRWQWRPERSIRNNAIAIAGGRIYLIDRDSARMDDTRRGEKGAPHPLGTLLALNLDTGKLLWKAAEQTHGTMLAVAGRHDVILTSYQDTRFKLDSEVGGRMAAFRASDGQRLWDVEASYGSRPIINDRTIYAQPGAWDLLTGKRKEFQFARSYGCGILAGSTNLLVYRSATLGYTDLPNGGGTQNYGGIRPGCWINVIPVGGLVLMPDATDRCTCSYLIKASIALKPMERR